MRALSRLILSAISRSRPSNSGPTYRRSTRYLAGGERMTPELFDAAPRLRAIARTGVGYDLIDVAAATRHRVAVTITPGTNQESVAEQALALLLALARRIVPNDRIIHEGGWDRALVRPVRGMTLGIDRTGTNRPGDRHTRLGISHEGAGVRYDSRRWLHLRSTASKG